jgi:hypothetical protein
LLPTAPLLNSESVDEFEAMHEALASEIKPRGFIENMYVADISCIVWEILRLRRCKAVIINAGFCRALGHLLTQVLRPPGQLDYSIKHEAEALALRWFSDQEAKKQVAELLGRFGLDESAIEAEAMRQSCSDLALFDRMLASLESRRDKALRRIGEYRDGFARQLRDSADRIVEADEVRRIEDGSSKPSSAA